MHRELVYEGSLGGRPIVLRLRCEPDAVCEGYYFDVKHGERIPLGAEDAAPLTLHASSPWGVRTGRIVLAAAPGAPRLSARWGSAEGGRELPITLSRIDAGARPRVYVRRLHERSPDAAPTCEESVQSFEVAGLDDPAMEQAVNDFFAVERRGVLTDATAYPAEDDPCRAGTDRCLEGAEGRTLRCPAVGAAQGYWSTLRAEVTYLDEALLSVLLSDEGYTGGAHPFFSRAGMNVDLRTGALVAPDAWFTPGEPLDAAAFVDPARYPEGVPPFSTALLASLPAPNVRDDLGALGLRPLFDGYAEAYVTTKALMLIPSVPEVSRHLRGLPAAIPWRRLRGHLRPESPVAHLAGR